MNSKSTPEEVGTRGATISECGKYRYHLFRMLNPDQIARMYTDGRTGPQKTCLFIMLNPSTADAMEDDPTIRRCMGFAKGWGYDRLEVVNVWAYRTTNPSELPEEELERFGNEYRRYTDAAIQQADLVVCGWGSNVTEDENLNMIRYLELTLGGFKPIMCLKQNKDGTPSHPLYLKKDLKPVPLVNTSNA